jgi:CheY-like chemotaxis protein
MDKSVNWIMRFSHGFTSFLWEDEAMGLLTAREAAEYLHVSLFTLGKIENEDLLVPYRTPGGHRRYSLEMLNEYLERTRSPLEQSESRILVVDDDDEVTDLLAETLPSCRFASAQDELRVGMRLAELKPDLVLVNTKMKGLDALDLCQRLDGHGQDVEVLAFEGPVCKHVQSGLLALVPADLTLLKERVAFVLNECAHVGSSLGLGAE